VTTKTAKTAARRTSRKPSAKQIAEREERMEQIHEELVAKTNALVTSEGWLEYLAFAARFRQYSFNNTMLILIQMPTASRVASYRKWSELGRQVRKGEKGLSIFAPMTRKREVEDASGEKSERRYVSGFRLVSVFDVSQTEGDALPEDPARPVLLDGEAPEGLWQALADVVLDAGYMLRFGPSERGENGYTSPSDKVIQITEGLSPAQSCKTLIHETAHMLLHCDDKTLTEDALLHRNVAEIEAESIAHIVAEVHGLPTGDYSIPYVAGWSNGKTEQIAATADRVLRTAKELLAKTRVLPRQPSR
jgi:antirestriction protein ArdC